MIATEEDLLKLKVVEVIQRVFGDMSVGATSLARIRGILR